jgi:glutaminyl-tRNA synthetase
MKTPKEGKLVFNKTVGLRDSWAKQKPKPKNDSPKRQTQQKSAISLIQQLGKKYTNLPEDKQAKAKAEIKALAKNVSYDELEPLFATAVKKAGTRIAVMITLKELLKNGLERNEAINDFVAKSLEDKNQLLVAEASEI